MKLRLQDDDGVPRSLFPRTHILLKKGKQLLLLSLLLAGTELATAQISRDSMMFKYRSRDLKTWTVGVYGGMLTPHTIFWSNKKNDFTTPTESFGYGISVRKQLAPVLGLQADVMKGDVKGIRSLTDLGVVSNSSYTTKMEYLASLTLNYTIVNLKMFHEFGLLGLYGKSGLSYSNFRPFPTNSGNSVPGYMETYLIPVGLGFKIGVSKTVNIDLAHTIFFVKSDRFDSYDYGNSYDKFSFTQLGLEIALGKKGRHQLAWYNPQAGGGRMYDDSSLRRAVARLDSLQKEDRSRYDRELGDTDHDGVANKFDKCAGTPDSVRVDGSGCPLPKFAEDILKEAFTNLEFEFGKATITTSSYPSLDKLAGLVRDHGYTLRIAGHTDDVGSDKFNLKLSKDRAEAVKTYLVGKGANASKVEATGYGEFQPITSNDTPEGRQKNRRVELTLY